VEIKPLLLVYGHILHVNHCQKMSGVVSPLIFSQTFILINRSFFPEYYLMSVTEHHRDYRIELSYKENYGFFYT